MRKHACCLPAIAIAALTAAAAYAGDLPAAGVRSIRSTRPAHASLATSIPKILLNDGLAGNYPAGYSGTQFAERAAFFQAFAPTIANSGFWPDTFTTTPDFSTMYPFDGITTVEHFMSPATHGGIGGGFLPQTWLSAGQKCDEYFGTRGAMPEWQSGNPVMAMEWFSKALHMVNDLCIPAHGDPSFMSAMDWYDPGDPLSPAFQLAFSISRYSAHVAAENEVCSRVMSWGSFEPSRNANGKYYQAGPHGEALAPSSWVDMNAHLFSQYRDKSDNLGDNEDWDYVANAIAPSFWGSAAGFANYFCDRVSNPAIGPKSPIGLVAYPAAPAGFEVVSETATQITLKWTHPGGGTYPNNLKCFRVHYGPMAFSKPQGLTGYDQAVTVASTARQVTITLPEGHPYYHYAVGAVNGLGMEGPYARLRDRWYVETYGNNPYSDITATPEAGDGWALAINPIGMATEEKWLDGPVLRKEVNYIYLNASSTVSWEQIDHAHALLFELMVQGTDGVDRPLIYAANASNHWAGTGYVDMGAPEEYNVPRTFNRNIYTDYQAEYGLAGFKLQSLMIGHFSNNKWGAGDHGGVVRNIVLPAATVPPAAPVLSGIPVWVPLGKGVPGPGSGAYWAKLSWTCAAGQNPIAKYEIQSKYTYYPDYLNRGYTTSNPWQDGAWTLTDGAIIYRVRAIDNQGIPGPWSNAKTVTAPGPGPDPHELDAVKGRPEISLLLQNTPNPFRGQTAISFQTVAAGNVELAVYNVQGQLVKRLASGAREGGYHSVTWDGRDGRGHRVPAGIYLYRLRAGDYTGTKKITVM